MITTDNKDSWKRVADNAENNYPSVGKLVEVVGTKKHVGKKGIVKVHIVDQYDKFSKYCDSSMLLLRQLKGRNGYVVLVQTETENFWVKANLVNVINI